MNKFTARIACLLITLCVPVFAQTQSTRSNTLKSTAVPNLVKFSGTARDVAGKPVAGVAGITFSLYQEEIGGAALWMETQNVKTDAAGHYTVSLGAEKPLPVELFGGGGARWLGVQVEGQAEQARVLLFSVPYALKAQDAETLGGKPASAFLQVLRNQNETGGNNVQKLPPPTHGNGTLNFIPLWTATNIIDKSSLFQSGLNVGVGTTAPSALLDVAGTTNLRSTLTLFPNGSAPALALWGTSLSVAKTGIITFVAGQTFPGGGGGTITGVTAGTGLSGGGTSGNVTLNLDATKVPLLASANTFAQAQTVNSNAQIALRVTGSAPSSAVIFGRATDTAGAPSEGVLGMADGTSGIGVLGVSNGPSGFGVEGNGRMNGVLGFSTTVSSIWDTYLTVGVHGDTGITNGIGVLGTVDGGYGVKGISDGTVINTAGTYGAAGPPSGFGGIAGVWGDAANHVGTYGSSTNYAGVLGESRSSDGVRGISHAASASGVAGTNDAPGGIGVYGGTTGGGPAGYFAGNVTVVGTISSYNNTPTVANGLASIVFQFSFSSNGGGNNVYQNLYTPPSDGVYRITAFQECTATSGGGTFFSLTVVWTLPTNGSSGGSVFGPDCKLLNGSSGSVVAHVKGGTPIQYNYAGMNAPFQTLLLIEKLL